MRAMRALRGGVGGGAAGAPASSATRATVGRGVPPQSRRRARACGGRGGGAPADAYVPPRGSA